MAGSRLPLEQVRCLTVLFFAYGYETVRIDGTPQLLALSVIVFVGLAGLASWRRFR
jgi:hypothetical protein